MQPSALGSTPSKNLQREKIALDHPQNHIDLLLQFTKWTTCNRKLEPGFQKYGLIQTLKSMETTTRIVALLDSKIFSTKFWEAFLIKVNFIEAQNPLQSNELCRLFSARHCFVLLCRSVIQIK
jgi:hypothetical protein